MSQLPTMICIKESNHLQDGIEAVKMEQFKKTNCYYHTNWTTDTQRIQMTQETLDGSRFHLMQQGQFKRKVGIQYYIN